MAKKKKAKSTKKTSAQLAKNAKKQIVRRIATAGHRLVGSRLKDAREARDLRDPFGVLAAGGAVQGWPASIVLREVRLDSRAGQFKSCADLLLIAPTGEVAIVECKLAKSAEAKHGMVEQVLMYAEMAHTLALADSEELLRRLQGAEPANVCAKPGREVLLRALAMLRARKHIYPIIVTDRWGVASANTVALTRNRINDGLVATGLPPVAVFVMESGIPEPLDEVSAGPFLTRTEVINA